MPSTRNLRRRIKSVKNTSQITKAMQMVAASKMRKAQQLALAARPYAELMNRVLAEVVETPLSFAHPLLEKRDGGKRAVIVISTDKGLCGALNGSLMREVSRFDRATTVFIGAGRKASQFITRTKRELVAEFAYRDSPLFGEARALSRFAQEIYTSREVDGVDVLFTQFVSTLTQRPEVRSFLPLGELKGVSAGVEGDIATPPLPKGPAEFLCEPSPEQVLGAMIPHYLNFQMYQFLLEAKASEHSARMVAMKNATDNAQQLIRDLSLEYNKIRQAAITNELLEISSAAMGAG